MSSAMLLERHTFGASTAHPATHTPFPAGAPAAANWCVLPRCTMKAEKTKDGMKLWCKCDDEVATGTLQNLCKMMADGMCSVCCTLNGIVVCQCNLTCGITKCEFTKDGVCISCTSGDKACCEIIQACCDCVSHCLNAGCCCYACFNNNPVCCGNC